MTTKSAAVSRQLSVKAGLRLRSKMLLGFCVPITATLLAVGLVSTFGIPFTAFEGTYGQERAEVLKNLSLVADLKKERFQLWLQERKDDVASLCEDQSVASKIGYLCEMVNERASVRQRGEGRNISTLLEDSIYQSLLEEFRALIVSHKPIEKIVVADAKSGTILVSTKENDAGLNVSRRPFFLTALREASDDSVDIERDPLDGRSHLIVSRVVKSQPLDDDGRIEIQAVVSTFVDTEEFLRPLLYTGGGLGETGEIVLVNQKRFILMSLKYPLLDGRTPAALEYQNNARPATLAAGGKEGMVIERDYRNVPVLAAYRNLRVSPSQGWGMVVKRDQAEVFGPLWDQLLYVSMVGFIGLLCALAFGIVAANRVSRPIRILSSTAREVEAGNLNVRSPITSADEVGVLAGTFNSMVERVQNWHQDLEEQVTNRTLQLNEANQELTKEIAQRKQAEQSLIKANRALRTLSDCNQTVIRFKSEEAMMTEVCRIVVEVGGYAMAWVGFAENDENKTVRPVAKFGLDHGYVDRLNITWDDEDGSGPTGKCIRTQAPSIMRAPAAQFSCGDVKEKVGHHSYRVSIALPLTSDGTCFGALNIYSAQPDAFDDDEVSLLSEMAGDLSFGVMALRTEQRLQMSEAKYREVVEHANSIIVKLDVTGRIIFLNDFGQEFFGYTQEELLGQNMVAMLNPEHESTAGHLFSTIDKIVQHPQEQANIETEGIRKNGERAWISWTKRATWEPDGMLSGILAVGNDITRLKRAEHALRESEERYRLLLDLSPDGVVAHSEGTVIFANRAAAELFGASDASALVGRPVLDLVDADYRERVKGRIEQMNMGKPQPWIEEKFVRLDGTSVDVEVSAVPVPHAGKQLIQAIFRDISAQKRAQEVQRRLATAIEQAAETIEITDTNGTILYVNPAFERTTGYTSDEAIGANPRILKSGRHDANFYEEMWATITSGKVWSGRLLNRKKDGTILEEEATISPIKDDSGKIVSYVAVKRDVTKEVSLQKQLLQAQKMEAIGTLAGGIAHDFNNLLQVTQGYSELLLTEKKEDDPEYPDLLKVFQAAKNGAELVKQLLTFSRKLEPKPIPLNLNRQITQFETLLRRTIPKMIDIRLDLSESLEEINADPTQMELVFMNLAVNARDAMPDGGTLVVTTRNVTLDPGYCQLHVGTKPGKYVLLKISDTGEGMDEKTLQHIFEPFYTTKEIGRGTGLGLAMVYGIVTQHGGYITCESQRGRGTSFRIFLPAFETEGTSGDLQDALMQASGTETILLVDDEDVVRDLAKRMLSKAGYTILAASNCREALEVYKRDRDSIALVILDLIMPEIGGRQCLEEILRIEPEVKVLVASGYAGDTSSRQTIEKGAKGFISKPFRVKNLLSEVRKILDSP